MKKEQFLELASQLFDQSTNLKEEEKIPIQEDLMDEIVDQIGSEIHDMGMEIISDYDLELHGNEIYLESCSINIRVVEKTIKEVLERYFTTFG